ncbi:sensor histidine kinase [Nonomuraea salmonea]|uniref:sensor histidine kinase n=1 Tax=Nonomuraea salmonea TaxID=46181 RepID=UPI0031F0F54D
MLKERLRISRDLHDGLGRSLTAIALKGDLAGRLIERDPASARTEVGELVQVAREAAQDVRQVARGYRAMSLSGEVDRAVALLESSGGERAGPPGARGAAGQVGAGAGVGGARRGHERPAAQPGHDLHDHHVRPRGDGPAGDRQRRRRAPRTRRGRWRACSGDRAWGWGWCRDWG